MSKVLTITGGRGFIGHHVAAYAQKKGLEVRFFDKRDGNDITGPLDALEGSDHVIHLAGVLGTDELFDHVPWAIEQNVLGSYRVAQWCADNGASYTGILVPDVFPSVYCATKEAARRLTTALHNSQGLPVSHVIAYNAHGPGQAYGPGHPRKFGPTFSVAAWNEQPIPVWGDGTALVDPVPVRNVARMLVDAIEHGDDVIFDGGLGIEVTVNEIADVVLEVTGSSAKIAYEPMRRGETPTNVAATGQGWDLLDWHPGADAARWRDFLVETVLSYKGVPFDAEYASGAR